MPMHILYMTFLRSYADDLPLQEWLYQHVFPERGQAGYGKHPSDLEVLGIMEYLTSGITTNFDMYYFPPVVCPSCSSDCGFRTVFTGVRRKRFWRTVRNRC